MQTVQRWNSAPCTANPIRRSSNSIFPAPHAQIFVLWPSHIYNVAQPHGDCGRAAYCKSGRANIVYCCRGKRPARGKGRMPIRIEPLRFLGAAVVILAGMQGAPRAFAQEGQLAEVVVSAQKREENAQNVPIAVTVVSGDTFNKANTSGFADVAKFAPSLTMTTGDQPANSSIVIRGIGTFAFSI